MEVENRFLLNFLAFNYSTFYSRVYPCVLYIYPIGTLIEAAKSGSVSRFIGRSQSEDSVCNQNRKESASHSNSPNSEAVTESPTDSNPSLDKPDHVDQHHHKSHHHSHHTNNSSDNSKSNNSNNKSHHLHLNFGALAALKRKRKKFSASRNESPVLEPPPEHDSPTSSIRKSVKKVILWLCLFQGEEKEGK